MPRPDLVVVAHNLHAGAGGDGRAKAKRAMRLMGDEDAQVGVFTEAKTAVVTFQANDLTVLAEKPLPRDPSKPFPEQGDTVVVVDDVAIRRWHVAVQKLRWVVRKYNQWHDPRRDLVAMLRGRVRGIRAVHLPPGGPNSVNGAAWREQMDDALDWADTSRCRVIVGDVNIDAVALAAYIHRAGIKAQVVGRGVDLCVVVNGTATAEKIPPPPVGTYDHPVVRYEITADRPLVSRIIAERSIPLPG